MNIKKYKNAFISILGDSISTFEGISVPKEASFYDTERKLRSNVLTIADTWWGRTIDYLQANLLVNNSIAGSTVTWNPGYEIQSYGCSDERTSSLSSGNILPDVIMVCLGINDWGAGVRVFDGNDDDLTVFINAYGDMLRKLKNNYRNAEIWCLMPAVSFCSAKTDFEFPNDKGGRHIAEYCRAIKRCADQNECKTIDLFNYSIAYDTIDGFHPNKEGMKTIADAVISWLVD